MEKKLIIINGVMGVGKTTISKALYKKLDNSFWLDGDNCWMMNPFEVTDENKFMVLDNISYILNNFIKNSKSKYIIFNWVIHTEDIMKDILNKIDSSSVDVYKITLMCSKENLINRINKDIKLGLRYEDNIKRSLDRLELYNKMDTIKIDTSNKSIEDIVDEIKVILSINN
ncbi:AAA family ATPase [Paeniclostridium sp. NSJ-45]|uniref:AAA family ATPase n=1 Tax=Paeniclostridium hominis TaxID=2764329 RepID=A0ABR7K1X1_9FIRM|nr:MULTISPECIES: AAA family ATPase [Paeniclostridium]MBC6003087.1 AAA family ATPase [Paeniclostridium hominis]